MNGQQRLLDLMTARATEGLDRKESAEFRALIDRQTHFEIDDLDLAAAELDLAFQAEQPVGEPMPAAVRRRILAQAKLHGAARSAVLPFPDRRTRRPNRPAATRLGWYAAAAMLLLALWSWFRAPDSPIPAQAPTVAQRQALLENARDAILVAWAPSEIAEYARVSGDVVWSNERQQGFMRLRGLPPNHSEVEQYQLWIVDPSRDEHPIDGGVFDIPPGADEAIVRIDAKLPVNDPRAFAITLEEPGGVVVSDGPLLVVAPV